MPKYIHYRATSKRKAVVSNRRFQQRAREEALVCIKEIFPSFPTAEKDCGPVTSSSSTSIDVNEKYPTAGHGYLNNDSQIMLECRGTTETATSSSERHLNCNNSSLDEDSNQCTPVMTECRGNTETASISTERQSNCDSSSLDDDLSVPSDSDNEELSYSLDAVSFLEEHERRPSPNFEEITPEVKLQRSLVDWVIECNVPRIHVSKLLKRLVNDAGIANLPLDARTLLQTQCTKLTFRSVPPGKYWHFGITSYLQQLCSLQPRILNVKVINLTINIDGLPLSKSSTNSFWPILGHINNIREAAAMRPFVIGVYYGSKKPADPNLFLEDFIREVKVLQLSGFQDEKGGYSTSVTVDTFLLDAPARAMVTGVVSHNAFHGCHKCETIGVFIRNLRGKGGGRVTFPETNIVLRTNEKFRTGVYEGHYNKKKERTALLNIGYLDMIKSFPLDFMHVVCLGVMRKLLNIWVNSPLDKLRMSKDNQKNVSIYLENIKRYIPSEFARKTRSLEELAHMKATEYRLHLLYTGIPAFYGKLKGRMFEHFILFHVAIKLLHRVSSTSPNFLDYANSILVKFVTQSKKIYGEAFISYNVHGLVHLVEDLKHHGSIDKISAFKFENKLQVMKNLVRRSGRHVQQLVRRLSEIDNVILQRKFRENNCTNDDPLSKPHANGPLTSYLLSLPESAITQYNQLIFRGFTLKTNEPDGCAMLKNDCSGHIVIISIKNIVRDSGSGNIHIVGRRYTKLLNAYVEPICSGDLGEFLISEEDEEMKTWPIEDLHEKMLRVPMSHPFSSFYFVSSMSN